MEEYGEGRRESEMGKIHMQSEYLIRISSPEPIERGSELSKANLPSAET